MLVSNPLDPRPSRDDTGRAGCRNGGKSDFITEAPDEPDLEPIDAVAGRCGLCVTPVARLARKRWPAALLCSGESVGACAAGHGSSGRPMFSSALAHFVHSGKCNDDETMVAYPLRLQWDVEHI